MHWGIRLRLTHHIPSADNIGLPQSYATPFSFVDRFSKVSSLISEVKSDWTKLSVKACVRVIH
jgi:hypothetical protein